MKTVLFPYGKTKISHTFGDELSALLEPKINEYIPESDGAELVKLARLGIGIEERDVVMHVVLGGSCLVDTVAECFVLQILHFKQVVCLA